MERKASETTATPSNRKRQPTSSYDDQTPTSNASPLTAQIMQSQWPTTPNVGSNSLRAVDESVKVVLFTPFPPLNNSSSAHNLAIHHEHLHPSSSLLSPSQSQSIGSMLSTDSFSPSVGEGTLLESGSSLTLSESSHPLLAAIASDDPQTRSILKAVTVLLKSGKVSSCHACTNHRRTYNRDVVIIVDCVGLNSFTPDLIDGLFSRFLSFQAKPRKC